MEEKNNVIWISLREKLADIEHQRWADWQRYVHSKFVEHSNGNGEYVCLPTELFKGWQKQIDTPYSELSEKEKDSDREQVDRYLPLIKVEIGTWNCPKCFDYQVIKSKKGFLVSKSLPKDYKGTYNKITKGKLKGFYRLFDYGTK